MTSTEHRAPDSVATPLPTDATSANPARKGLARLGAWTGSHLRAVLLLWLLVLVGFGAFAPQVESALSGAGWQDSGSQSVQARSVIEKNLNGLGATALQVVIHDGSGPIVDNPAAQRIVARAEALLKADPRVSVVVAPATRCLAVQGRHDGHRAGRRRRRRERDGPRRRRPHRTRRQAGHLDRLGEPDRRQRTVVGLQ